MHQNCKYWVIGQSFAGFSGYILQRKTSSQAPSYASPKLSPTDRLTGVKCRATSVAKNPPDQVIIRVEHICRGAPRYPWLICNQNCATLASESSLPYLLHQKCTTKKLDQLHQLPECDGYLYKVLLEKFAPGSNGIFNNRMWWIFLSGFVDYHTHIKHKIKRLLYMFFIFLKMRCCVDSDNGHKTDRQYAKCSSGCQFS